MYDLVHTVIKYSMSPASSVRKRFLAIKVTQALKHTLENILQSHIAGICSTQR